MSKNIFWRIALPTPLWRPFDYLPCETDIALQPGMRIKVPFGTRILVGIFLNLQTETEIPQHKLKAAYAVLDQEPLLSPKLMHFCQWVSEYYHHPMGEVLLNALPKKFREGKDGISIKIKIKNKSAEKIMTPHILNQYQAEALKNINAANQFKVFLLAGVTGSGKTEVYLQAIEFVLSQKKEALLIVPEISLTPQTVDRFQQRFQVPLAVMHSGLSAGERARMWLLAKENFAPIVIGTRSAIFAPLKNLGLIIVDEEHDSSLKSQSNVRYSARDMAVMRAQLENIPVILGSATPALESFFNAKQGRYQLFCLPNRAGKAKPPQIKIIDLRDQKLQAGLSAALIAAIRVQLSQKKQVFIFLNRRGFAPVMLCHHCGFMINCQHCDAKLTFHARPPRLVCHHCERISPTIKICPQCHQTDLMPIGQGTEKIENVLQILFPNSRILRVDRDTTTTRRSLEEKLALIIDNRVDILIGTQMLAKGHHFPNLGLSAVVDLDGGFFSLDFRAIERMCQLLVQVSGRAGRGESLGEVIIQTHHPQHPYLQQLFQQGYLAFLESLLTERKQGGLPPFSYQAVIRASSPKKEKAIAFLQEVKQLFLDAKKVLLYGPVSNILERKAGRYHHQLILQSRSRADLQAALQSARIKIPELFSVRSVRWAIDVDPSETV